MAAGQSVIDVEAGIVRWTLLMLAAHPEWQEALREEIEEVVGGDGEDEDEGPLELDRGSSSPPTAETNEPTRAAPAG